MTASNAAHCQTADLLAPGNTTHCSTLQVIHYDPPVLLVENFIKPELCDAVVAAARESEFLAGGSEYQPVPRTGALAPSYRVSTRQVEINIGEEAQLPEEPAAEDPTAGADRGTAAAEEQQGGVAKPPGVTRLPVHLEAQVKSKPLRVRACLKVMLSLAGPRLAASRR